MDKNKNNKVIVLLIIGIILIVSFLIFFLNYSKDDSSLSILEKKWVNDNKNKIVDVSVFNDVPIYGLNGKGIIFNILDYFSELYEINFNKISYLTEDDSNLQSIKFNIVDKDYKITKEDIFLYKDKYVLVSNDNKIITNLNEINNKKIGVFSNDISSISSYLSETQNTSYQPFNKIQEMELAINNKEIDYIAIPHNIYLVNILTNGYTINYHIDELYKNYILTINDKDLYNIMNKTINVYNDNLFEKDYNEEFLNVFFNSKGITQEQIENYNTFTYQFGYVVNMPYINKIDNEPVGIVSNYLNDLNKKMGFDFKLIKYDNIKELNDDFSKGELDVIFTNHNLSKLNIDVFETVSPFNEKYVVLAKEDFVVNSIKSLENHEIDVVKDTYLYNLLKKNKISTNTFENTDDLIRNIKNDSIIILDYETYKYYKNSKFSKYHILYENNIDDDYKFIIKDIKNNKTLIELFNYYIASINYKEIQNKYNTDYVIKSNMLYSILIKLGLIIITMVIIGLIVLKYINKNKKNNNKKIAKEDKIKYIDTMTSLKNRNYLNYNIKKWDENVIYPQAIVIIDLNNIKYINDNYGHEEGDEVIKQAANILMINQKENTDIIRTDGNEFLIYMVGYNEQEVVSFNRKISKELKEIKYNFGAAIGYSMIKDDLVTIDDAINEATLLMRETKEKQ